jgi:hypothetical protein
MCFLLYVHHRCRAARTRVISKRRSL